MLNHKMYRLTPQRLYVTPPLLEEFPYREFSQLANGWLMASVESKGDYLFLQNRLQQTSSWECANWDEQVMQYTRQLYQKAIASCEYPAGIQQIRRISSDMSLSAVSLRQEIVQLVVELREKYEASLPPHLYTDLRLPVKILSVISEHAVVVENLAEYLAGQRCTYPLSYLKGSRNVYEINPFHKDQVLAQASRDTFFELRITDARCEYNNRHQLLTLEELERDYSATWFCALAKSSSGSHFHLQAEYEGTTLTLRKLDETYPNYQS